MPNTVLSSVQAVRDEVKIRLGGSRIEVELDEKDVRTSLGVALREYSRHVPGAVWAKLPATTSTKKYRIDNLIPGLKGVTRVTFVTQAAAASAAFDPFSGTYSLLGGAISGEETIGDLDQRIQYLEDASKVISAEPEWHAQWEQIETPTGSGKYQSQYFIYVDLQRATYSVAYRATFGWTDDVTKRNGMLHIPEGDVDAILNFVTARSKAIVARVLGKFGGITNSDGGQDPTDAAELRTEAAAEEAAAIAEFKLRRSAMAPEIE